MIFLLSIVIMLVIAAVIYGIGVLMTWIGLIQSGVPFWFALIAAFLFMLFYGNIMQKRDRKKKVKDIHDQINEVDRILKSHNM